MRIAATLLVVGIVLMTCGEKPRPSLPFILTERGSLGFGTEFGGGTFIGTVPQEHLSVSNEGLQDLKISDVTQSGDTAFAFRLEGQAMGQPPSSVLPLTVKPAMQTFIEFTFTPADVRRYHGAVVIKSNADNVADLEIKLSGCGIRQVDAGVEQRPHGGCVGD
jgi:hypothetical protein